MLLVSSQHNTSEKVIILENLQVRSINTTTLVQTGVRAGQPTNLIHEVTYTDGSVMYRCSTCGKEFPKWASVFAHRASHSDKRDETRAKQSRSAHKRGETRRRAKMMDELVKIANDIHEEFILNGGDADAFNPLTEEVERLRMLLAEETVARKKAEREIKQIRKVLLGQ